MYKGNLDPYPRVGKQMLDSKIERRQYPALFLITTLIMYASAPRLIVLELYSRRLCITRVDSSTYFAAF